MQNVCQTPSQKLIKPVSYLLRLSLGDTGGLLLATRPPLAVRSLDAFFPKQYIKQTFRGRALKAWLLLLPVEMELNGLGGGAGEDGKEDSIC